MNKLIQDLVTPFLDQNTKYLMLKSNSDHREHHFEELPANFIKIAASEGHLEIFKWWKETKSKEYYTFDLSKLRRDMNNAFKFASYNNHISLLEWFHESGVLGHYYCQYSFPSTDIFYPCGYEITNVEEMEKWWWMVGRNLCISTLKLTFKRSDIIFHSIEKRSEWRMKKIGVLPDLGGFHKTLESIPYN